MNDVAKDTNNESHASSTPQKLSAQDFEIYAPRALALADKQHVGVADKGELAQLVASPAAGADAKTQEAAKFVLEHYDFLSKLSRPVSYRAGTEQSTTKIGNLFLDSDEPTYYRKSGISAGALQTVTDVLEGRQKPNRGQLNNDDPTWMWAVGGDIVGMGAGAVGGIALDGALGLAAAASVVEVGVIGVTTLGTGLLVGAAVGAGAYYYYQHQQEKTWNNVQKAQYSTFLKDIQGTEAVRRAHLGATD